MEKLTHMPIIGELCNIAGQMYRLGWAERNGGNISVLLSEAEASEFADSAGSRCRFPLGFDAGPLAGKVFLTTGTGVYFRNIGENPENTLGAIRIRPDGSSAELLWGYEGGGGCTSELPAHLMGHMARLSADKEHRVVMHTHPTYTIAMNTACPADEADFTRRLWQINTECVMVFPDGVGVLPCMTFGTGEIGHATAEKLKSCRLAVWTNHGVYGTGKSLDDAFGLIETVEKAAQIYMLTEGRERVNVISDGQLRAIAARCGVVPREGILPTRHT